MMDGATEIFGAAIPSFELIVMIKDVSAIVFDIVSVALSWAVSKVMSP
jgi:hypothetical protein